MVILNAIKSIFLFCPPVMLAIRVPPQAASVNQVAAQNRVVVIDCRQNFIDFLFRIVPAKFKAVD